MPFPPVGPRRITTQRQIAIPVEVMNDANMDPGVEVYCQVQDDPPGTVLLIPTELLMEWVDRGRLHTGPFLQEEERGE